MIACSSEAARKLTLLSLHLAYVFFFASMLCIDCSACSSAMAPRSQAESILMPDASSGFLVVRCMRQDRRPSASWDRPQPQQTSWSAGGGQGGGGLRCGAKAAADCVSASPAGQGDDPRGGSCCAWLAAGGALSAVLAGKGMFFSGYGGTTLRRPDASEKFGELALGWE